MGHLGRSFGHSSLLPYGTVNMLTTSILQPKSITGFVSLHWITANFWKTSQCIPHMPKNIQHAELCHSAGDHYDCIVDKQNVFPASPLQLQRNSTYINVE